MPNDQYFSIEIKFILGFKRNIRALSKKYRHIRSDKTLKQLPFHSILITLITGETP